MKLPHFDTRYCDIPTHASTVLSGLVLLVVLGLVYPTRAQSVMQVEKVKSATERVEPEPSASGYWKPHFDEQISRTLQSAKSGLARGTLLRTLIHVSVTDGKKLGYPKTVSSLVHVVENDPSPQHRLLALQALQCLGPEQTGAEPYRDAILRIYDIVQTDSSTAVRRAAAEMVHDFRLRSGAR